MAGTLTPSPIFQPQFISGSGAALLIFAPSVASGGTVVPANYNFIITTCRIVNTSSSPETLEVSRVPNGDPGPPSLDNHDLVVYTITIPTASIDAPWFDVTTLWGAVLQPGDSIAAAAGSAVLSIAADGYIQTLS